MRWLTVAISKERAVWLRVSFAQRLFLTEGKALKKASAASGVSSLSLGTLISKIVWTGFFSAMAFLL